MKYWKPKKPRFGKYISNKKSRWWKNKQALEKACTPPKEGHIYVFYLGYENFYKIGMSVDVDRRLRDPQASNPKMVCVFSAMVRDARKAESFLHKKFKKFRTEREIFKLDDISSIDKLIAPFKYVEYG